MLVFTIGGPLSAVESQVNSTLLGLFISSLMFLDLYRSEMFKS